MLQEDETCRAQGHWLEWDLDSVARHVVWLACGNDENVSNDESLLRWCSEA
jgi:hypothetical protein